MTAKECRLPFEDTAVSRMKEKIFNMIDDEIEDLIKEYEIPSSG